MSSPAEIYVKGIHEKFNFYAAWPPNEPRALGDVGRLKNGEFQRLTTLGQLGIPFKVRTGSRGQDLSHSSGSSVSVEFKAQGQTLSGANIPQAKAGALVQFSAAGAFLFQAAGPTVCEIEDQVALARQILQKFRTKTNGKRGWEPDWFVITDLLVADTVTVLLSNSKSSKIELAADGTIPAGPAPLASVGARLNVVTQKGEVTSVLAGEDLTPMFRLSRVRRSIIDRILGGDESADVGRAGIVEAGRAPLRVLEPVPVIDAFGKTTRAWLLKPTTESVGKKTNKASKVPAKSARKVPAKKKTATRKKAPAAKVKPKPAPRRR